MTIFLLFRLFNLHCSARMVNKSISVHLRTKCVYYLLSLLGFIPGKQEIENQVTPC